MENKKYLKKANNFYINKNYADAFEFYNKAKDVNPALSASIEANIKLTKKKMGWRGDNINYLVKPLTFGIICTPHVESLANRIRLELEKYGWTADVYIGERDIYDKDFYFVLCPQMFNNLPPGEKRICFQLEQSVSSRWMTDEYISILNNSYAMLDYSLSNIEYFIGKGVVYPHVYYLPVGANYEEFLVNKNTIKNKSIDLLFYGDSLSSKRRTELIDLLKTKYNVHVENNLFGEDLFEKIKKSKLVVNIHYYDNALLEMPRLAESLTFGAIVVSEKSSDQIEYPEISDVVHYCDFYTDDLFEKIDKLLINFENIDTSNSVQKSSDRFCQMFLRFLIGSGLIEKNFINKIEIKNLKNFNGVALSLPETIKRRKNFLAENINDVVIFDGVRRKPSWLGCGLSFISIMRNAVDQNLDSLLIMEDDVEFKINHDENYELIKIYLNKNNNSWDIFSGLIAVLDSNVKILKVEKFNGIIFVTLDKTISMVFNVYSKKIMDKIIKWNYGMEDALENTIDKFIEKMTDLRVVTTLPFLVGHKAELDSSLWNISNSLYTRMINESEELLRRKVEEFKNSQMQNN